MENNNFVYTDLSTYNLNIAKDFYTQIFNWEYTSENDVYHVAHYNGREVSGLYTTPEKFKKMDMPSFWMSYIQVDDVQETVQKAKELGGIIELVDLNNPIGGIALIRDTSGAGFTIYEGNQLNTRTDDSLNTLVWNELYVSDANLVIDFYKAIFNWRIEKSSDDRYLIFNSDGDQISAISEVSNDVKGKHEYWGVFFKVGDIEKAKKILAEKGGKVIYDQESYVLCSDPFGAVFHLTNGKENSFVAKTFNFKWKAILGLGVILASLAFNWFWMWGLLFFIWIIPDLRRGSTHLFEYIEKKNNPMLYWSIMATWIVLSLYSTIYYLSSYRNLPDSSAKSSVFNELVSVVNGEYQNNEVKAINEVNRELQPNSVNKEKLVSPDTLKYKVFDAPQQNFIGISTALSGDSTTDEATLNKLWKYFLENDISSVIQGINDERVYCVFSEYDSEIENYASLIIGYRVDEIREVYQGLESLSIPSTSYAVFEGGSQHEKFISETWDKVVNSDMELFDKSALEVYTLDNNYEIIRAELRISLN
jgi:predicted enzyme related to lactoylglutathione lyase/predicted transcriptional regulator YdeE